MNAADRKKLGRAVTMLAEAREIMAATGAKPTHDGGDVMITHLQSELDTYASEVDRLYSPIWSCLSAELAEAESDEPVSTRMVRLPGSRLSFPASSPPPGRSATSSPGSRSRWKLPASR